jgi:hypothetical protein
MVRFPVSVREVTVVACRLAVPALCAMLPLVVMAEMLLNVPTRPDTDPVAVRLSVVVGPATSRLLVVTVSPWSVPFVFRKSAYTSPVNTVSPALDDAMFCSILLTASPLMLRVVQLILVAATSTASMFLICAFTVVGMNSGLWPQMLIALVNITLNVYFILSDLVPLF